jgi:hypothetical protein
MFSRVLIALAGLLIVIGGSACAEGSVREAPQPAESVRREYVAERLPTPTPTFSREADGGAFFSTYELVATLDSLGIPCWDPYHYTSQTDDQVVECGTGRSRVLFAVARPGNDKFRDMVLSDPSVQNLNTLYLVGRNWVLNAACDHRYGNRVKDVIGGQYLRTRFLPPSNCPIG